MPVTARLSLRFYEKLGDDLANELVDWMNAVDAANREDLRQLNELNFSRFDANVGKRFAESDLRFAERAGAWDRRISELDAKWETRFAELDAKWETRFAELDAKWETRFAELDVRLEKRFADLRDNIATARIDMIRWGVMLWVSTALAIVGLYFKS